MHIDLYCYIYEVNLHKKRTHDEVTMIVAAVKGVTIVATNCGVVSVVAGVVVVGVVDVGVVGVSI